MKYYKKEEKLTEFDILSSIECDKCHKIYDSEDFYEIQEFHHIDFVGGYGSIFGDMTHIECDICQHCLKGFIDGIYREDDRVWIMD